MKTYDPPCNMIVNGLSAQINLPDAPKGEEVHGLPPYRPTRVHAVDEYHCPANWMHGSAKASSYFIGVEPGKHLWIDFNQLWQHTHDIAIVLSIQGINPITGQQTKQLRLEQYVENCPVHNQPFKGERLCEACGYKWPAQNYMTTTSWPYGQLWIDGFRAENGKIRGFLITEETMKGVAAQLIGEERVWAIGMAFFLSKEAKPTPVYHSVTRSVAPASTKGAPKKRYRSGPGGQSVRRGIVSTQSLNAMSPAPPPFTSEPEMEQLELTGGDDLLETTKLEIGAGAKIQQELAYHDPKPLSYYEDEPHGMIYVNYVPVKEASHILSLGRKDTTKEGEGFLHGLDKGNPVVK